MGIVRYFPFQKHLYTLTTNAQNDNSDYPCATAFIWAFTETGGKET